MRSAAFAGVHVRGIGLLHGIIRSLLTVLVFLSWCDAAGALPCLEDRFGSSVNCTANDIRITDFHDIVVTDDGCTSLTDTVRFNAVLTVVTTATSRYDIGLFIGLDGEQALTGQCVVQSLPTGPLPYRSLDRDGCGDTSSSMIVMVPVTDVTVSCVDANENGLLDVAACTSWQQNGNKACSGPADVVPGTAAKCNCPLFPFDLDIPVPEMNCETNTDCADRAPGCNDGVCDVNNPAADGFGCVLVPNHASCADNKFCNGAEVCSPSGDCVAGTPVDCDDDIACTADDCSEQNDTCTHTPNHAACSNQLYCDGNELCDVVLGCQPGAPVDCGDGIDCTVDSCVEASDSCAHAANDDLCSNGQFCDGIETCSAKNGCRPGTPVDCNDSVVCTSDACNEANDTCTHAPDDDACDDGEFCNGAESCSLTLGCQGGTPPVCSDSVECTTDTCNPQSDMCTSVPDDSGCDDSNVCTADQCDPVTGCSHTPASGPCSDGNPCTTTDVCSNGACVGSGTSCGNGVIDATCGETCDPGNHEICDNLVDDDNDGLIDCSDPDCTNPAVPTCTETCTPAPPCVPLARDPAIIRVPQFEDAADSERSSSDPGSLVFHGRMTPESPMNPLEDGFAVTLTNANGEIFRAEVPAVDIGSSGEKRFFFRTDDLERVYEEGGIAKLRIRRRDDLGKTAYAIYVTAYGDFSRATLPAMTTQVYFGNDVAFVTAVWNEKPGRWTLYPTDYDGGR